MANCFAVFRSTYYHLRPRGAGMTKLIWRFNRFTGGMLVLYGMFLIDYDIGTVNFAGVTFITLGMTMRQLAKAYST